MSKQKYLAFTDNRIPRLLTNPTKEVLALYDKDQIVKQPKSYLKNVPLEHLVLENGEIRKINKSELEEIQDALKENRPTKSEDNMLVEIEKKLKEISSLVSEQGHELDLYKRELEKAKSGRKWKKVAIISIISNIALLIPIVNHFYPFL